MTAAGGTSLRNIRIFDAFRCAILGKPEAVEIFKQFPDFPDPEGLYYMGRACSHVGALDEALDLVGRAERRGFFCYPFLMRDPWLDPLRGDARLNEILHRAESKWRDAQRAFESHPGSRVLSIGAK